MLQQKRCGKRFALTEWNFVSKSLSQTINEKYQVWVAHHMTHMDNLRPILHAQELRSYNLMRGQSYRNLANEDVQAGRAAIVVSASQWPLHDYVPLYLGFKTPMVAINQAHNEDLLFLRFSLDVLATSGSIVCDGNARSLVSKFYLFNGPDVFSNLDVAAIRSVKYAKDPELKRKKQAEILIPDKLPVSQMLDIICYSESAKIRALSILREFGIKRAVKVNQGWYFINSPQTGPKEG
jgi:ssDNA thymidine ADP-ribosyltransferase, DarT